MITSLFIWFRYVENFFCDCIYQYCTLLILTIKCELLRIQTQIHFNIFIILRENLIRLPYTTHKYNYIKWPYLTLDATNLISRNICAIIWKYIYTQYVFSLISDVKLIYWDFFVCEICQYMSVIWFLSTQ